MSVTTPVCAAIIQMGPGHIILGMLAKKRKYIKKRKKKKEARFKSAAGSKTLFISLNTLNGKLANWSLHGLLGQLIKLWAPNTQADPVTAVYRALD